MQSPKNDGKDVKGDNEEKVAKAPKTVKPNTRTKSMKDLMLSLTRSVEAVVQVVAGQKCMTPESVLVLGNIEDCLSDLKEELSTVA